MRHALYLPPFGELADPHALVDLAVAAEERAWDGLFLWDHVLRPSNEPPEIADPWVGLAAMAASTQRIRLGPMITPLARRRPQMVAREIITLDRLSDGRLIMGFGLGVDTGRELSAFGEVVDQKQRGDLLDEGIDLVASLASGEEVDHHGEFFTAENVRLLPRPVQLPRPPFWLATRGDARRPVRRGARYEGLFPIEVDRDQLARIVDIVVDVRGDLDAFDIAVLQYPGVDLPALEALGATWAMHSMLPGEPVADVLDYIELGPEANRQG